jgi:hypothetical protein
MSKIITLYKKEYLVGYLEEDIQPLLEMILENYNSGRNMSKSTDDIRYEDIRISFTPQVQRIAKKLTQEWEKYFGEDIELCWQNEEGQDPNSSFWAVVHQKNESTNLHTHESMECYENGAQVSCAFWIQTPTNGGDLVFQYNSNPYRLHQEVVEAKAGKFVMFDSTLPHFVTKNQSDELRIVISMNFKYKNIKT